VEGFVLLIAKQEIVFVFNMNKRERNHHWGAFYFFGGLYFLRSFYFRSFYFFRGFYFLNLFTLFWGWRWDVPPFFKVESQHEKISTEREEK
jgi:hypothetical protein